MIYDQTGPFESYAWQRDEGGMTRVFCGPQWEGQRGGWAILWIECPDAVVRERQMVIEEKKREEGKKE